jgi:hypothetical protein
MKDNGLTVYKKEMENKNGQTLILNIKENGKVE